MAELQCDKCAEVIARGARFCPACGDPVTDADRPISQPKEAAQRVRVVCPKCSAQTLYDVDLTGVSALNCGQCNANFTCRVVVVRAKRSSGSKRGNRRSFSIRVQLFTGAEELIQFVNVGTDDFELRSRDIAVFSYLNGQLRVVQNLKIAKYMTVSKPACYLATFAYGAESDEVKVLRRWRDQRLLVNRPGAWATRVYYRASPWFVAHIGGSRLARAACRSMIAPLLWVIGKSPDDRAAF